MGQIQSCPKHKKGLVSVSLRMTRYMSYIKRRSNVQLPRLLIVVLTRKKLLENLVIVH